MTLLKAIPELTERDLKRFWAKVRKTDTCWFWDATCNHNGYGVFSKDNVLYMAHRVSYALATGERDLDLHLDHIPAPECGNRNCVNPEHVQPVTKKDPGTPMFKARKSVCINGHALTPENVYVRPDGTGRGCKKCRSNAFKRYYARNLSKEARNGITV